MIELNRIVVDNEYATIWCYPTERILHHQFHRYGFGEPFGDLLMIVAEYEALGVSTKVHESARVAAQPVVGARATATFSSVNLTLPRKS